MKPAHLAVLAVVLVTGSTLLGRVASDGSAGADEVVARPAAAATAAPTPDMTEQGAVDAAVHFLGVYGSEVMFDPTARRRTLAVITSDAERARVLAETDQAFALAARALGLDEDGRPRGGSLLARLVPVGADVVSFAPPRARVSVWSTALLGVAGAASRVPVQESWSTETVDLLWEHDGWRWVDVQHKEGPAPVGSAQVPADHTDLVGTHRSHAGVAHD